MTVALRLLEWVAAGVVGVMLTALVVRSRRRRAPLVEVHVAQRAAIASEESRFSRILVPTRGDLYSERMVSLACKLARRDDADVEVLYVVEVPLALPATAELPDELAKAGEALSEAEVIARALGLHVRGRVFKARFAGKAIVDVASRDKADLIVLGAPPMRRHGDWGRTVEYVFRRAPCDVIVERPSGRAGAAPVRTRKIRKMV